MPGAVVHVNRRLSDLSFHYPQEFESVGDKFFPEKPVDFLTDQFVTANKANLLAIRELTPLGDDDTPPQVNLKWDADTTYNCQVYGVASPGKWITERNADPSLDYETERTIQLTLSLRMRLEYLKVKQKLRNTSVMTSYTALGATTRFDAYTSAASLPIKTMQLVVDNIGYANSGRKPNRIAMTSHVLRAICRSEEFKDLVKYSGIQAPAGTGEMGQKVLVEMLIGVAPGTIQIADHVYNGAAEGQTPAYYAFMGPDIVFGFVEEMGLRKWSMSAQFQWSAYPGSPTSIISVPQYNRGLVPTEEHRAFTVIDPKVIKPELGYLLTGVLDSTDSTSYGTILQG